MKMTVTFFLVGLLIGAVPGAPRWGEREVGAPGVFGSESDKNHEVPPSNYAVEHQETQGARSASTHIGGGPSSGSRRERAAGRKIISKAGLEKDTDDPDGVIRSLEQLKAMRPGPGVMMRDEMPVLGKENAGDLKRRRRRISQIPSPDWGPSAAFEGTPRREDHETNLSFGRKIAHVVLGAKFSGLSQSVMKDNTSSETTPRAKTTFVTRALIARGQENTSDMYINKLLSRELEQFKLHKTSTYLKYNPNNPNNDGNKFNLTLKDILSIETGIKQVKHKHKQRRAARSLDTPSDHGFEHRRAKRMPFTEIHHPKEDKHVTYHTQHTVVSEPQPVKKVLIKVSAPVEHREEDWLKNELMLIDLESRTLRRKAAQLHDKLQGAHVNWRRSYPDVSSLVVQDVRHSEEPHDPPEVHAHVHHHVERQRIEPWPHRVLSTHTVHKVKQTHYPSGGVHIVSTSSRWDDITHAVSQLDHDVHDLKVVLLNRRPIRVVYAHDVDHGHALDHAHDLDDGHDDDHDEMKKRSIRSRRAARQKRFVDSKDRGHADSENRDHADSNDRGHADSNDRGHVDSNDRGHADSKDRGHVDSKDRGHADSKDRGHADSKDRGHADSENRDHVDSNDRGHVDNNDRGHVDNNDRGHVDNNDRGHVDNNYRGHVDRNNRGHAGGNDRGHVDNPISRPSTDRDHVNTTVPRLQQVRVSKNNITGTMNHHDANATQNHVVGTKPRHVVGNSKSHVVRERPINPAYVIASFIAKLPPKSLRNPKQNLQSSSGVVGLPRRGSILRFSPLWTVPSPGSDFPKEGAFNPRADKNLHRLQRSSTRGHNPKLRRDSLVVELRQLPEKRQMGFGLLEKGQLGVGQTEEGQMSLGHTEKGQLGLGLPAKGQLGLEHKSNPSDDGQQLTTATTSHLEPSWLSSATGKIDQAEEHLTGNKMKDIDHQTSVYILGGASKQQIVNNDDPMRSETWQYPIKLPSILIKIFFCGSPSSQSAVSVDHLWADLTTFLRRLQTKYGEPKPKHKTTVSLAAFPLPVMKDYTSAETTPRAKPTFITRALIARGQENDPDMYINRRIGKKDGDPKPKHKATITVALFLLPQLKPSPRQRSSFIVSIFPRLTNKAKSSLRLKPPIQPNTGLAKEEVTFTSKLTPNQPMIYVPFRLLQPQRRTSHNFHGRGTPIIPNTPPKTTTTNIRVRNPTKWTSNPTKWIPKPTKWTSTTKVNKTAKGASIWRIIKHFTRVLNKWNKITNNKLTKMETAEKQQNPWYPPSTPVYGRNGSFYRQFSVQLFGLSPDKPRNSTSASRHSHPRRRRSFRKDPETEEEALMKNELDRLFLDLPVSDVEKDMDEKMKRAREAEEISTDIGSYIIKTTKEDDQRFAEMQEGENEMAAFRLRREARGLGGGHEREVRGLRGGHEREVRGLSGGHEREVRGLRGGHEREVRGLSGGHEREVRGLRGGHEREVRGLRGGHEREVRGLRGGHEREVRGLSGGHEREVRGLRGGHEREARGLSGGHEREMRALNGLGGREVRGLSGNHEREASSLMGNIERKARALRGGHGRKGKVSSGNHGRKAKTFSSHHQRNTQALNDQDEPRTRTKKQGLPTRRHLLSLDAPMEKLVPPDTNDLSWDPAPSQKGDTGADLLTEFVNSQYFTPRPEKRWGMKLEMKENSITLNPMSGPERFSENKRSRNKNVQKLRRIQGPKGPSETTTSAGKGDLFLEKLRSHGEYGDAMSYARKLGMTWHGHEEPTSDVTDDFEKDVHVIPDSERQTFDQTFDAIPGLEGQTIDQKSDVIPDSKSQTSDQKSDPITDSESQTSDQKSDPIPDSESQTSDQKSDSILDSESQTFDQNFYATPPTIDTFNTQHPEPDNQLKRIFPGDLQPSPDSENVYNTEAVRWDLSPFGNQDEFGKPEKENNFEMFETKHDQHTGMSQNKEKVGGKQKAGGETSKPRSYLGQAYGGPNTEKKLFLSHFTVSAPTNSRVRAFTELPAEPSAGRRNDGVSWKADPGLASGGHQGHAKRPYHGTNALALLRGDAHDRQSTFYRRDSRNRVHPRSKPDDNGVQFRRGVFGNNTQLFDGFLNSRDLIHHSSPGSGRHRRQAATNNDTQLDPESAFNRPLHRIAPTTDTYPHLDSPSNHTHPHTPHKLHRRQNLETMKLLGPHLGNITKALANPSLNVSRGNFSQDNTTDDDNDNDNKPNRLADYNDDDLNTDEAQPGDDIGDTVEENDEVIDKAAAESSDGIEVDVKGQKAEQKDVFAYIEKEDTKESTDYKYSWGQWSECSVTCGLGQRFRSNRCGNDQPCTGELASAETKVCSLKDTC